MGYFATFLRSCEISDKSIIIHYYQCSQPPANSKYPIRTFFAQCDICAPDACYVKQIQD